MFNVKGFMFYEFRTMKAEYIEYFPPSFRVPSLAALVIIF